MSRRVPLVANKLVSPVTLSSIDYRHLPLCQSRSQQPMAPRGAWDRAVTALHGDLTYEEPVLPLYFKRNIYCGQLCLLQPPTEESFALWRQAIQDGYYYQFLLDGLPVAYRYENQDRIAVQYWGGIPLGLAKPDSADDRFRDYNNVTAMSESSLFLYNHYRIEILHDDRHILRTTIHPLSIRHNVTDVTKWPAVPMGEPMPQSCRDRSQHLPIYYGQVRNIPPQPWNEGGGEPILFTYDVLWKRYEGPGSEGPRPFLSRWSIFLEMDQGVPVVVPVFNLLVALIINAMLLTVLVTWVLRDLSYKPLTTSLVVELESETQAQEAQLWPLSTRVLFPPQAQRLGPWTMVLACGTGAQWLVAGLVYVILFRCGIVNESLGAQILTPAIVIYVLASLPAGYVSGRMSVMLHQSWRVGMATTLAVATIVPLLGMVVIHLVYDVLPDASVAPSYQAMANATPVVLVWLFAAVPLTMLGGYWGFRHGPLNDFPVSTGSGGYQDLALQDEAQENQWESADDEWKPPILRKFAKCWYSKGRLPVLFLLGGLAPMACGFVEYAYGVAGPVFMGYFTSSSLFAIASFVLFLTCVGAISVLLFYKHIRMQNYQWWWASFVTGASCGLYILLLSMSWVSLDASGRQVNGYTMLAYFLWFLFGSICVGLMTGFVAIACCILFIRTLYRELLKRWSLRNMDDEPSSPQREPGEEELMITGMRPLRRLQPPDDGMEQSSTPTSDLDDSKLHSGSIASETLRSRTTMANQRRFHV